MQPLTGAIAALIALKHTHILYFKVVGWILNTFLCSMPSANFGVFVCPCLCTSPSEPIHSWQSRILYFSTVPATAHRHSTFGLRCAVPPGTQPIRTSAPCLKTFNSQSEHHHPSTKQSTANQNIHTLKQLLGCCTRPHITFLISIASLIPLSHIHIFTKGKRVTSMV